MLEVDEGVVYMDDVANGNLYSSKIMSPDM